ncbi:hypothetical protein CG419_04930 [Latilactobacillus curvatus]|uniref:Uncharacterized protein n=1 Tax=Latilactobacillus curvatus TaxID=28038 RepID=A0AAC9Y0J4_LATCU|nr:hypothetical protein [Latilactobacillus curvatus]ASN60015.1 hypothetical protein CG419_04930 [Latilactobacillus curvatus]
MSKLKKRVETVLMFCLLIALFVVGAFIIRQIPYDFPWWIEAILTGGIWLVMLVVIGLLFSGRERQ